MNAWDKVAELSGRQLADTVRVVCRIADTTAARQAAHAAEPAALNAFERAVEAEMIDVLRHGFPDVPVLAEEHFSARGTLVGAPSERTFVLDPLDGSLSYLSGNSLFGMSLTLCQGDTARHAFVYRPATGTLFHAVRGCGAYEDGSRIRTPYRPLRPTAAIRSTIREDPDVRRLERFLADVGHEVEAPMLCSSLRLCMVGSGHRSGVVKRISRRFGHRTWWGTAAGLLVAAESGASVVTLDGSTWRGQDADVFAVHPWLLSELRAVGWARS